MSDYLGPAVLAFVIAACETWLELVTTKYPRTFRFLLWNGLLYGYCFIYGAIAAGVTLAFPALSAAGALQLGGMAQNPWLQGAAVGVAVKSVLHIRLFTIQSVPIGLETLVLLFEPWLLQSIDFAEFTSVRRFLRARADAYTNPADPAQSLKAGKDAVLNNLPRSINRGAFQIDLDKCTSMIGAMELYLRECGEQVFDLVFPLPPPAPAPFPKP